MPVLYTPEEIVAELDRLGVDRAETTPGRVPVDGRTADALDTVVVAPEAGSVLHTVSIPVPSRSHASARPLGCQTKKESMKEES